MPNQTVIVGIWAQRWKNPALRSAFSMQCGGWGRTTQHNALQPCLAPYFDRVVGPLPPFGIPSAHHPPKCDDPLHPFHCSTSHGTPSGRQPLGQLMCLGLGRVRNVAAALAPSSMLRLLVLVLVLAVGREGIMGQGSNVTPGWPCNYTAGAWVKGLVCPRPPSSPRSLPPWVLARGWQGCMLV